MYFFSFGCFFYRALDAFCSMMCHLVFARKPTITLLQFVRLFLFMSPKCGPIFLIQLVVKSLMCSLVWWSFLFRYIFSFINCFWDLFVDTFRWYTHKLPPHQHKIQITNNNISSHGPTMKCELVLFEFWTLLVSWNNFGQANGGGGDWEMERKEKKRQLDVHK